MKVCIVGASGKLGQYMVQHPLSRGYELVGVGRAQSVGCLDADLGASPQVGVLATPRRQSVADFADVRPWALL
jgi:short-subunit dehydrogenase